MVTIIKKIFSIEPDRALHKHWAFWLPIVLFLGLALVLSSPAWCLCWPNIENYENILKQQSFPIFVASICIPVTVAINRFHSSAQQVKSNALNEENMAFNHYFDHRNHFYDYLNKVLLPEPERHYIKIINPLELYEIIFPLNSPNKTNMRAPNEDVIKC